MLIINFKFIFAYSFCKLLFTLTPLSSIEYNNFGLAFRFIKSQVVLEYSVLGSNAFFLALALMVEYSFPARVYVLERDIC